MILAALLLAQTTPAEIAAWDGLPMPDAVANETVRYVTCIGDPVEGVLTSGQPADPAARQALLDRTLAGCRPVRAEVAAAMETKLAGRRGWTDATVRHLKVERMLAAMEERVGFTTVNREDFLKKADAIRRCVNAGGADRC